MNDQSNWQTLIEQLSQASDEDALEAAKLLGQQHHEECVRSLIQFVRSQQPHFRRELALYALAWMHNPQLIDTFIQVLRDSSETETVRGQAAEALGMLFDGNYEERSQNYYDTESALLDCISDSSAVVRFWCCYGLGNMRSHRAISQLEVIREQDHGLCPGWWYVSEEAENALARISGRPESARIPVHLRTD